MMKNEKIKLLKEKLSELHSFHSKLNEETIDEFNNLKEEIISLLDENQQIRFNQIEFYEVIDDSPNQSPFDDDLPF